MLYLFRARVRIRLLDRSWFYNRRDMRRLKKTVGKTNYVRAKSMQCMFTPCQKRYRLIDLLLVIVYCVCFFRNICMIPSSCVCVCVFFFFSCWEACKAAVLLMLACSLLIYGPPMMSEWLGLWGLVDNG